MGCIWTVLASSTAFSFSERDYEALVSRPVDAEFSKPTEKAAIAQNYLGLGDSPEAGRLYRELLETTATQGTPPEVLSAARLGLLRALSDQGGRLGRGSAYQELLREAQSWQSRFGAGLGLLGRDQSEARYRAAIAALRLNRQSEAKRFLEALSLERGYELDAAYLQGRLSLVEGDRAAAQRAFERSEALAAGGASALSLTAEDTLTLARLNGAREHLVAGRRERAAKLLQAIPSTSRYYSQALLGRAISLRKGGSENELLEALVLLKRVADRDPNRAAGIQAQLLAASTYEQLGAVPKAVEALKEARTHTQETLQVLSSWDNEAVLFRSTQAAVRLYASGGSREPNLGSLILLQTDASERWLPQAAWYQSRLAALDARLSEVRQATAQLRRPGFDPIRFGSERAFLEGELLSPALVQQLPVSEGLKRLHGDFSERTKRLEVARRYLDLLLEEHRWETLGQMLLEDRLAEKLGRADKSRQQAEEIRRYYLDEDRGKRTEAVLQLEERLATTRKNAFAEDRLVRQIQLHRDALAFFRERLQAFNAIAGDMTPKEIALQHHIEGAVERRLEDAKRLSALVAEARDVRTWSALLETIDLVLAGGLSGKPETEVAKVREFLEQVETQNREAQEEMQGSLYQIRARLMSAHREVDRRIVLQALEGFGREYAAVRARLANAQDRLVRVWIAQSLAEAKVQRQALRVVYEAAGFELAKLQDRSGAAPSSSR